MINSLFKSDEFIIICNYIQYNTFSEQWNKNYHSMQAILSFTMYANRVNGRKPLQRRPNLCHQLQYLAYFHVLTDYQTL